MRKPLLALGGLAAVLLPLSASAGAVPSFYETLPKGSLSVPSQFDLPDSIPATERVDGVYAEVPDYVKNNPNPASRYIQVFGSQHDAEIYQTGVGDRSGACVVSSSPSGSSGGAVRWNSNFSSSATVSPFARAYSYGPDGPAPKDFMTVAPVRIDRVTHVDEDGVTLETKIALVDSATLGARLVRSTSAEFKLVQTLPGRMKVYAMKDADSVTFLVRHELLEGERNFTSMFGRMGNFDSVSAADECPLTFSLPVHESSASTMVLQLEAVLEIRNAEVQDAAFGESDPPPPSMGDNVLREARIRPMQIGFSSTWLSQDQAPVLSISHGWTGKERIQPM